MYNLHFLYTSNGKVFLEREYRDKGRTSRDIAAELAGLGIKCYFKMVLRAVEFHGMHVRTRSESMLKGYESGRKDRMAAWNAKSEESKKKFINSRKNKKECQKPTEQQTSPETNPLPSQESTSTP